jgi:hypothetical protein
MSKKKSIRVCAEANAFRHMGAVLVVFAANLAFGSHEFQHSFLFFVARKCTLCRNFLSFDSPDRRFFLVTVILGARSSVVGLGTMIQA